MACRAPAEVSSVNKRRTGTAKQPQKNGNRTRAEASFAQPDLLGGVVVAPALRLPPVACLAQEVAVGIHGNAPMGYVARLSAAASRGLAFSILPSDDVLVTREAALQRVVDQCKLFVAVARLAGAGAWSEPNPPHGHQSPAPSAFIHPKKRQAWREGTPPFPLLAPTHRQSSCSRRR